MGGGVSCVAAAPTQAGSKHTHTHTHTRKNPPRRRAGTAAWRRRKTRRRACRDTLRRPLNRTAAPRAAARAAAARRTRRKTVASFAMLGQRLYGNCRGSKAHGVVDIRWLSKIDFSGSGGRVGSVSMRAISGLHAFLRVEIPCFFAGGNQQQLKRGGKRGIGGEERGIWIAKGSGVCGAWAAAVRSPLAHKARRPTARRMGAAGRRQSPPSPPH